MPKVRCKHAKWYELSFERGTLCHPDAGSLSSPYRDEIQDNGCVLIYEEHDAPKQKGISDPKLLDQLERHPRGALTENGKISSSNSICSNQVKRICIIQVYEKIKPGIWTDNGFFHLVDSWIENDETRNVFKFKLVAVENVSDKSSSKKKTCHLVERSRIIPTRVKLKV